MEALLLPLLQLLLLRLDVVDVVWLLPVAAVPLPSVSGERKKELWQRLMLMGP